MPRRNQRRNPDQGRLEELERLVREAMDDVEWRPFRPTEQVADPRGILNTTTVESGA